jgi:hypothetical protein
VKEALPFNAVVVPVPGVVEFGRPLPGGPDPPPPVAGIGEIMSPGPGVPGLGPPLAIESGAFACGCGGSGTGGGVGGSIFSDGLG